MQTLPNVKQTINMHWHLLQINSNLRTAFQQQPFIAYRRNKNLDDVIGSKKILDSKSVRKNNSKKQLYVDHAFLEEIIFVVNKFWKKTASQVTQLTKRSKFFIN